MKRLQIWAHYIGLSILLIHSFVSHHHHSEISFQQDQIEHRDADGIIDFIALVFHNDHSEEQMEEFTIAQNGLNSENTQVLDFAIFPKVNFCIESFFLSAQNCKDHLFLSPNSGGKVRSLRAPPVIS